MKAEAEGHTMTMGQLITLANSRGKFIELLCRSLGEFQELAEAGRHEELAAKVIECNRDVLALLNTMQQGVSAPH